MPGCPNCGFVSDPETGDVFDVTYPCPRCGHGGAKITNRLASQVVAKYKSKKKIKTESGEMTVYEYSDRQIANRNKAKAEQVEKLSKKIGELRSKVKRDMKSSDPETMLTALAVALIDETFERVGNEGSAEEGHFGVTGWQKKHLSFGRDVSVSYVGKSGVKHKKRITDAAIKRALRDAYESVEGDDACIFDSDGAKVTAEKVNAYLKNFDVTAKDIRGYHANKIMAERLRAVRKSKLPEDKKAREKQLKEEFKTALEETAEEVGHEAATLAKHYLSPGLESSFLKDGEIVSKLGSDLAHIIVARFLETGVKTAMISLRDTGTWIEISGPYGEMSEINPKLKTRGFRWEPSSKVWRIEKSKITDRKMKTLQELLGLSEGGAPAEDLTEKQKERVQTLAKERLVGFDWIPTNDGVRLRGDTYALRDQAKKAGGVWSLDKWVFGLGVVLNKSFENLVQEVQKSSKQNEGLLESITSAVYNRSWPTLRVAVRVYDNLLLVTGQTRPVKDIIQRSLGNVRFVSDHWEVSVFRVTLREVQTLLSQLDQAEKEAVEATEKPKSTPPPVVQTPARPQRSNERGDYCSTCGVYVPPREGILFQSYDDFDDEEHYTWRVRHRDAQICKDNKEEARLEALARHNRAKAIKAIEESIRKDGTIPSGSHRPSGNKLDIKPQNLYGGGEWLVVEPDHVWFVLNNGADGDDWSRNNVETGGAGAIGWRAPLTGELKAMIDGAFGTHLNDIEKTATEQVVARYLEANE
jgi:hypothetical protein